MIRISFGPQFNFAFTIIKFAKQHVISKMTKLYHSDTAIVLARPMEESVARMGEHL